MDNSKLRFVALVIVGLLGLAAVGAGLARCDADAAAAAPAAGGEADAGEPAIGADNTEAIVPETAITVPAGTVIEAPAAAPAVAPAITTETAQ